MSENNNSDPQRRKSVPTAPTEAVAKKRFEDIGSQFHDTAADIRKPPAGTVQEYKRGTNAKIGIKNTLLKLKNYHKLNKNTIKT
jgi:hypothetical protein